MHVTQQAIYRPATQIIPWMCPRFKHPGVVRCGSVALLLHGWSFRHGSMWGSVEAYESGRAQTPADKRQQHIRNRTQLRLSADNSLTAELHPSALGHVCSHQRSYSHHSLGFRGGWWVYLQFKMGYYCFSGPFIVMLEECHRKCCYNFCF